LSNDVNAKSPTISKSENYSKEFRHIIDTSVFRQLSAFEMVVSAFDGIKQREPHIVYSKPEFLQEIIPHNKLMKLIGG
jgi:hypothetical protein